MKTLSRKLLNYFADEEEFKKALLPTWLLFDRFPNSEIRLHTSKSVIFVNKTDIEDTGERPPEAVEPTHAERVQAYFAEKEKQADAIFAKAAKELEKLGKQELIKKLRTAVTFYESGDWIDDDGLARKPHENRT